MQPGVSSTGIQSTGTQFPTASLLGWETGCWSLLNLSCSLPMASLLPEIVLEQSEMFCSLWWDQSRHGVFALCFFLPLIAESWAVLIQSHIPMGNELHGQETWEEAEPHNRSCAVKPTTPWPEQATGHSQPWLYYSSLGILLLAVSLLSWIVFLLENFWVQ